MSDLNTCRETNYVIVEQSFKGGCRCITRIAIKGLDKVISPSLMVCQLKAYNSGISIALDVDGVLADVMPVWLRLYNHKYGAQLTIRDVTKWNFWMPAGIDRSTFYRIFSQAWNLWREILPTEERLEEKVLALMEKGRVDIVTGRSRDTVPHVKKWLLHHQIAYNNFITVPYTKQKASLAYSVFIDDAPGVAISVAKKGGHVALYDQPWNRDVQEGEVIVRVKNLTEAFYLMDRLAHSRSNVF